MKEIEVGTTLLNGATVIAVAQSPHTTMNAKIVLAFWRDDYVTWIADGDTHEAFYGIYFHRYPGHEADALLKAATNFAERTGQEPRA